VNKITVVIPVSPIPSHPSPKIVLATIQSIRQWLPDSPIIVGVDGWRDTGRCTQEAYDEFKLRLTDAYRNDPLVRIKIFDSWGHQSGNLGPILDEIQTPLMFYLESDWEILADVRWEQISDLILSGEYNSIKLHPNPRIHPCYEYMMFERLIYQGGVGRALYLDGGGPAVGIIRTRQFSANPHLASTEWYRKVYQQYLAGHRDFIENLLHGPVASESWTVFKQGILNPLDGDMFRCRHLDGRGTE